MKRAVVILAAALAVVGGCRKSEPTASASPRIITFAPNITDLAFDMGLGEHVAAVSSYCICPAGESRPAVGNAFKINSEAILAVEPDILFYNTKDSDYDSLRRLRPGLKLIRIRNGSLAELRAGVAAMGEAVGRSDLAEALQEQMDQELAAVERAVAGRPAPRVLFLLGAEHPSTIGAGWLTDELLTIAGGKNAAAELGLSQWAKINLETVLRLQPEVLICQSEPAPEALRQTRAYWERFTELEAVKNGRLYVSNDRRLTIVGSRAGQTARKLAEMIHPEAFAKTGDTNGGAAGGGDERD